MDGTEAEAGVEVEVDVALVGTGDVECLEVALIVPCHPDPGECFHLQHASSHLACRYVMFYEDTSAAWDAIFNYFLNGLSL